MRTQQPSNQQIYNRYRDGVGGAWIWRASNRDVRAIAAHLKIPRLNWTKTELISLIVAQAPELA